MNSEFKHYESRVENLTSGVTSLIKYIDDVSEQNIEMTTELQDIYAEINKLRKMEEERREHQ